MISKNVNLVIFGDNVGNYQLNSVYNIHSE